MENKENGEALLGYNSPETAYVVDDYPYGFRLRCKIRYWIETTKNGDRFCSQTTNPKKAGEFWNKPKKSTYSAIGYMLKNPDTGYIGWRGIQKGWSDDDRIDAFLEKLGGKDKLNKQQLYQLAYCRAINKTNKAVTVEIVQTTGMSADELAAFEAKQKENKQQIGKLLCINGIQAEKDLGLRG